MCLSALLVRALLVRALLVCGDLLLVRALLVCGVFLLVTAVLRRRSRLHHSTLLFSIQVTSVTGV